MLAQVATVPSGAAAGPEKVNDFSPVYPVAKLSYASYAIIVKSCEFPAF